MNDPEAAKKKKKRRRQKTMSHLKDARLGLKAKVLRFFIKLNVSCCVPKDKESLPHHISLYLSMRNYVGF